MRKWFSILLALVLIFIPYTSLAAQVPLALKGKNVYIPEENDIELVSYNVFFRIRTGFSSANTSMVVKNPNLDQATTIQIGIPLQINNISKIRDLSVSIDGKSPKVIQRNSLKNPPSGKEVDVKTWYVWDVSFEPGESKVVECSFAFDNKLDLDGTEILSFPLGLIDNWTGKIKNIQIIADLDFYGPYAFIPAPSINPTEYDNGGRLTFKLSSPKSIPSTFDLSFKPMDNVIAKYFDNLDSSNNDINAILEAYRSRSYHKAITLIHEFLSNYSDEMDIMAELKYLEALCYQNLYDLDKALNLFNQLEPNPGFGESLSPIIKNKIIYDKYFILKNRDDGEQEALEYLKSIQDSYTNQDIFSMWLDKEISILTPPVVIEEKVEEEPETPIEDAEKEDTSDNAKVIDKFTIAGREFYIEEILFAIIVLIIILFIIFKIIARNRRKRRGSIFRY